MSATLQIPVLEARGVHVKSGGQSVLAAVDFSLRHGEMIALVGPNGAGKSTLLRALAGVQAPSAGVVLLQGRALSAWPQSQRAQRVAWLGQSAGVAWDLSVRELAALGRLPWRARGLSSVLTVADCRAIDNALQALQLEHLQSRPVLGLSGGELQRVQLARVLASDADVLLLDEPLAALDPKMQLLCLQALRARAQQGACIFYSVHDWAIAAHFSDRAALLEQGRLRAIGRPDNVLTPELLAAVYGVEVRSGSAKLAYF